VSGEAALVPELHGQADNVVSFGAQHGRDGGGIDSPRHGYGDGLLSRHFIPYFGARSERCIEILDPGPAVNTMWRGMKSIQ
jgi:hypothetical protein